MIVPVDLLGQLDLSDEEPADAMRAATARMSQGGAGSVSTDMTDFLARTTSHGRNKSTVRTMERILSDCTYTGQLTVQHETVQTTCTLTRSLNTR